MRLCCLKTKNQPARRSTFRRTRSGISFKGLLFVELVVNMETPKVITSIMHSKFLSSIVDDLLLHIFIVLCEVLHLVKGSFKEIFMDKWGIRIVIVVIYGIQGGYNNCAIIIFWQILYILQEKFNECLPLIYSIS